MFLARCSQRRSHQSVDSWGHGHSRRRLARVPAATMALFAAIGGQPSCALMASVELIEGLGGLPVDGSPAATAAPRSTMLLPGSARGALSKGRPKKRISMLSGAACSTLHLPDVVLRRRRARVEVELLWLEGGGEEWIGRWEGEEGLAVGRNTWMAIQEGTTTIY